VPKHPAQRQQSPSIFQGSNDDHQAPSQHGTHAACQPCVPRWSRIRRTAVDQASLRQIPVNPHVSQDHTGHIPKNKQLSTGEG
jgi:hypothetical protein